MTPIQPLGDRIIVRKTAMERQLASGIHLPDSMREQSDRGEVVAVGPGRETDSGELIPIRGIEVGDTVVFGPYAGSQVIVESEEFLLLRVGDVFGTIALTAAEERQTLAAAK